MTIMDIGVFSGFNPDEDSLIEVSLLLIQVHFKEPSVIFSGVLCMSYLILLGCGPVEHYHYNDMKSAILATFFKLTRVQRLQNWTEFFEGGLTLIPSQVESGSALPPL